MVKIENLREAGTVRDLPPIEREQYISFLQSTYQDNIDAAEFFLLKFPRWSIIAGYYSMHDISKLLLGKMYNLKLSIPGIHGGTIQCLLELIKRKDIIELLEKADSEYNEIISLHGALLKAKGEREKSQYYTTLPPEATVQKASYFLEHLVKPYLKLVQELMK